MTDLENVPAKRCFRPEKRPDSLRVDMREPAGCKGAAEGSDRECRGDGGPKERPRKNPKRRGRERSRTGPRLRNG
jgi:hypothetical protein